MKKRQLLSLFLSLSSVFFFSLYLHVWLHLRQRGEGAGTAFWLRTPQCAFLSACRLSSLFPTSPLTGAVVVDGPCCRPLHLAGLIGREKFLRCERVSKGLCLFARLRAMNNLLIITASTDPLRAEATIYSRRTVSNESVVLTIAETLWLQQLNSLSVRSLFFFFFYLSDRLLRCFCTAV